MPIAPLHDLRLSSPKCIGNARGFGEARPGEAGHMVNYLSSAGKVERPKILGTRRGIVLEVTHSLEPSRLPKAPKELPEGACRRQCPFRKTYREE